MWGYSDCKEKMEKGPLISACASEDPDSAYTGSYSNAGVAEGRRVVTTVKMWQQSAEFHPEFHKTCRKWTLIQVEDKNVNT